MLVKTKYANIFNIAANEEIIPELLQSSCNPKKIFDNVSDFLDNPEKIEIQIQKTQLILNNFRSKKSSSEQAALALNKILN